MWPATPPADSGLRTISFDDANADGIIDISEVALSDSAVFQGSALPTREVSLNSRLALWDGRVTIGTQFDYRGGHLVDNSLEQFRCFSVVICRGVHDRTAPIDEQARAQATYLPGVDSTWRSSSPDGSSSCASYRSPCRRRTAGPGRSGPTGSASRWPPGIS